MNCRWGTTVGSRDSLLEQVSCVYCRPMPRWRCEGDAVLCRARCLALGNGIGRSPEEVEMRKQSLGTLVVVLMALSLYAPALTRNAFAASRAQFNPRLVKQIRHELATLPYYGVFDWLEFETRPDGTVVLRGQGGPPAPKADAGASGPAI